MALFAALATVAVRPVMAQSPEQRDSLVTLRDSLAGVSDSVSLLAYEKRLISLVLQPRLHDPRTAADSAHAAMIHLRIGLVDLRAGDLAGRVHYDGSASEFQWATELAPKWPFGWYGLGLAELGFGDYTTPLLRGLQTMLGKDALTRSAMDFARSAEVDPSFVQGLVELSNTALRQRTNIRLGVALAALRRSARTPAGHNALVLLMRARVERIAGSADSALAAVNTLLETEPDNAAGLLELARTRFFLHRVDGGTPWYRGLGLADHDALAAYRSDLLPVLPDSSLHAFDAGTPEQRVALMRGFWTARDDEDLHRPGERLEEHYRRLDVAERTYRLVSTTRHYDIVERYRPTLAEFDDRGVIYVRQGEPSDRRSLPLPSLPPNETWVYHRPTGELIFNFVAREGPQDYRLVESVLDALGNGGAIQVATIGDIQDNQIGDRSRVPRDGFLTLAAAESLNTRRQTVAISQLAEALIQSRDGLSPIYARMMTAGKGSAGSIEAQEREIGRQSIAIGTRTDSWPLTYTSALPGWYDIVAVGSDSAGQELQVTFAIPGSALHAQPSPRGVVYPVAMRFAAFSLDGKVVASVDTVRSFVAPTPIGANEQLVGRLPVHVPPGTFTVRLALEAGDAGVITPRDTVKVASPLGPALGLSDLAVGTRAVQLAWRTPQGDSVWLNPSRSFRSTVPLELYFEVTGLAPGTAYRYEIAAIRPGAQSFLHKLFGAHPEAIHITFNRTATGAPDPVRREVATDKLEPGKYILQVTVSTASGEKVVRRRDFTITK